MILADTSVWVDHLRRGDSLLMSLLDAAAVVMHPFVLGEIACGSLADRATLLGLLRQLPTAVAARDDEVLDYVERHVLHGRGLGYVDMHLLTSVALTPGASLWTRDKRLQAQAVRLGQAYQGGRVH